MYWNEQYLLQAFLVFNSRFEVIWPGNHMILRYPDEVCSVFSEYSEMRKLYRSLNPPILDESASIKIPADLSD